MGLSNNLRNWLQMYFNHIYCNFIQLLWYLPMTTNALILFILYLYTIYAVYCSYYLLLLLLNFIDFIIFIFIVYLLQLDLFTYY